MARINLESRFLADPRFRVLVGLIGDEDKAIGMSYRAWALAQKYWADDRSLVPERLWIKAGLEPLIDADLAERRDGGIYCRGAEAQFEWLVKENRREAGRKSAEARRKKYGTALPAGASNLVKTSRTKPNKTPNKTELLVRTCSEQKPNRTELSLLSIQGENPETPMLKGGDVWNAYRAAYFARYAVEPVRNAEANTHCAALVKKLGGDAAVAVVRFYLTHSKRYYVENCHSLRACAYDAAALHTQMLSGRKVTAASAAEGDRQASNVEAMKEAMRILEARDAKE